MVYVVNPGWRSTHTFEAALYFVWYIFFDRPTSKRCHYHIKCCLNKWKYFGLWIIMSCVQWYHTIVITSTITKPHHTQSCIDSHTHTHTTYTSHMGTHLSSKWNKFVKVMIDLSGWTFVISHECFCLKIVMLSGQANRLELDCKKGMGCLDSQNNCHEI